MIATAKLPGPCARSAAISPATPSISSAAAAARNGSGSSASAAAVSAEPAQPMAVGNLDDARAVGDPIEHAGERDHASVLTRKSLRRGARRFGAGQNGEL